MRCLLVGSGGSRVETPAAKCGAMLVHRCMQMHDCRSKPLIKISMDKKEIQTSYMHWTVTIIGA